MEFYYHASTITISMQPTKRCNPKRHPRDKPRKSLAKYNKDFQLLYFNTIQHNSLYVLVTIFRSQYVLVFLLLFFSVRIIGCSLWCNLGDLRGYNRNRHEAKYHVENMDIKHCSLMFDESVCTRKLFSNFTTKYNLEVEKPESDASWLDKLNTTTATRT